MAGASPESLAALSGGIVAAAMTLLGAGPFGATRRCMPSARCLPAAGTYLSIGFIFVTQLHAAIAPRILRLDRF